MSVYVARRLKNNNTKAYFFVCEKEAKFRDWDQISWMLSKWNEDESTKWLVRLNK